MVEYRMVSVKPALVKKNTSPSTPASSTASLFILAQMAGQEYRVIWPLEIAGKNGNIRYMVASPSARLYRSLDVEETNLPAGTYYLEYEVTDVFLRSYVLQRQEMHWDGSKLTFTDDPTWEGSRQLTWTK